MSLLNIDEAAKEIRISACTLRRLIRKGEVKHRRVGGKIFFLPSDIENYIEGCAVPATGASDKEARP